MALTLILKTEVSNVILANLFLRYVSKTEIDEEMSLLRRSKIEKSTVYTGRTKLQKQVISVFDIRVPFRDIVLEHLLVDGI